jgi:hypothetical protein
MFDSSSQALLREEDSSMNDEGWCPWPGQLVIQAEAFRKVNR